MRCEHHPGVPATAQCEICEIPLCGVCSNYTAKAVLCDRCVNSVAMSELFASRAAPTPRSRATEMGKLLEEGKSLDYETPSAKPRRKAHAKIWDSIQIAGIVGCFVFIGIQVATNFGRNTLNAAEIAAEERQRAQIESCLLVFWEIAEMLKNNQVPRDSMRCGESGLPNIVARVDDDIIVRHPQPELLGYSDIVVSRRNPVPVLVQ